MKWCEVASIKPEIRMKSGKECRPWEQIKRVFEDN